MKKTIANLLVFIIVVAILVGIFCLPFAVIWALNTLFPVLTIPYTFWTYLSVCILNLTWFYKANGQNFVKTVTTNLKGN